MKKMGVLPLAFTYVGCFLGAGFVSGQELWQFFGAFGGLGFLGFAVAVALFVFFGVVLMGLVYNLITLLGIDSNFQNIFIGCFLALSVVMDTVRREKTLGKNI